MYIDSHAHLFLPNFEGEVGEIISRAKESGVDYIIVPATNLEDAKQVLELTKKYDSIYGAVGVHPHETKDWNESYFLQVEELASNDKIVAIGEIGLDYHYDYSPPEKQIEAFKSQLDLALKLNLPVIIHNRESDDDMMKIIRSYCGSGLKAQFHCFDSTLDIARELISMNYFISFTGNITFKNAEGLTNVLQNLRLDHVLLETDSPFMTPVPNRGKRNEPANLIYIAEKIAETHKMTVNDVSRITNYNVFKLFGIGSEPNTTYTYKLGDSLYLNITNRCNANCTFCRRKDDAFIRGFNLKMSKAEEPDAEAYIKEIGDPKQFKEIIFCGYGEPTIRWDLVKQVAKYVKDNGGNTRLNTNGHCNYINKRNIAPEFKGLIDVVSISLNTADPRQYSVMMGVETRLFNEMITFAKSVKQFVNKVIMSIVSVSDVEVEKARKVTEEKIGAEFRVRHYF
jgi:TatD DNase family protein